MKTNVYNDKGQKGSSIDLPIQFSEEIRDDLIRRAVIVIQNNNRQRYGAAPRAGQRPSAVISKRRRSFRGCYGKGISRVPRKVLWKRGRQHGFVGAFAPGTVGGRKAHPPKATKTFSQKINIKERRKAIRSALSATAREEIVRERGHKFKNFVLVVDNSIENFKKTKEVKDFLIGLGLKEELERNSKLKVRPGKGKKRGRKYKIKKSVLFVVSKNCNLMKAAANILGVDTCIIDYLNVGLLAPGAVPGRLTLYTEEAIKRLDKEKLFTGEIKKKQIKKVEKDKEMKKETKKKNKKEVMK